MDRSPGSEARAARHSVGSANAQERAITVLVTATVTHRSRRR